MIYTLPKPGKSLIACLILMGIFALTAQLNAETVVYSQGFETDDGGYSHTGILDSWQWGTPSPSFLPGPAAHSGLKCWGTNLMGEAPANSDAYASSPPIALPSLSNNQVMRIRFFGWIAVDFMFDRGEFQISKDGNNWETKAELFCTMQGGWNEYTFDISDYAGGMLYIRFRCEADGLDYFDPIPYNMAGFYIDDIAVTIVDAPPIKTTLTFTGWENQDDNASCPWIYSWADSQFTKDNDIFSTARGADQEYTDYYMLKGAPQLKNGNYYLRLRETQSEESHIDLFKCAIVDHPLGENVANDEYGNVYAYKQLTLPISAIDKFGNDLLPVVAHNDQIGFKAYNGDYVDLNFDNIEIADTALLVIKTHGFLMDTAAGSPTYVRPLIEIQTQDEHQNWITRNSCYPRMKPQITAYDLHTSFVKNRHIRLVSRSCLTGKYNLIDFVGLSVTPHGPVSKVDCALLSAEKPDGTEATSLLAYADNNYAYLDKSSEIDMKFDVPSQPPNTERNFLITSKGFYVPNGTFFFYTWNGGQWVQRDGWTSPGEGDQTRTFDLSQWLPDPDGDYKIQIWQDFIMDPAGINCVKLTHGGAIGTMNYAIDLMENASILQQIKDSDAVSFDWDWGAAWPDRNRRVEIGWSGFPTNYPPSTNPVTFSMTPVPAVFWTYHDPDGNPQTQASMEVWTGAGGTGSTMWNPTPVLGAENSALYEGQQLINGHTYFARVKAFDGTVWGPWSECSFVYTEIANAPPVAEAGPSQTVFVGSSCNAEALLDGSGSTDPDGDPLTYAWSGAFGSASGAQPAVNLGLGFYVIRLAVNDGKGGVSQDSVGISVVDSTPPVPDQTDLPAITGSCTISVTNIPTATDNCSGPVYGETNDPLIYSTQGVYFITWKFKDAGGNVTQQKQKVIVKDETLPVPDIGSLPTITGNCEATISTAPTATDNCKGKITGTTTNPLTYTTPGIYTVSWNYDDSNGNIATQLQTVVVISSACCNPPTDSAYSYAIVANNITWTGSGVLNSGSSTIQANGQFTMSGSSDFIGNVASSVKITKNGSTTIYGNAKAPAFKENGSGKITGTKTIGPVPQIDIPTIDFTPYYNWALSKGAVYNGNLHLTGSRDTIIPGGVLWVNGTFKLSGSMKFTGCVIATGDIDISGSGDFTRVKNTPVIASVNGGISLSGSGKITGLIFAKNGGITKSGSGDVVGSLICKTDLKKSGSWSTLTYTKFPPLPPDCN
jgi:hypothetical protein